jgi:hypothetical protein
MADSETFTADLSLEGRLMYRLAALATALMMAAACGSNNNSPTQPSGNTGPIVFTAQLNAANEAPPVTNADANGRGQATITFNVPRDPATGNVIGGGTVNFSVQLQGFPTGTPVRNAHIHTGAAGIAGGVFVDTGLTPATAVTLTDGTGTLTLNNAPITQEQATQIVANPGNYYFNAHTQLNPGGAVRGQLVKQ